MTLWGSASVLSEAEIASVVERAMRILAEIGVRVEHPGILARLAEAGAHVEGETAFFDRRWTEELLETSTPVREDFSAAFECSAGAYPLHYLPPGRRTPLPHTVSSMIDMLRLADSLEGIDIVHSAMGAPSDADPLTAELLQRLLRWKYFRRHRHPLSRYRPYRDGPSVVSEVAMCAPALEMAEIMAAEEGGLPQDYCYADVYLSSPLRFDRNQAAIFAEMHRLGCHCEVGTVVTLGGS